jgi:hypothetical protein
MSYNQEDGGSGGGGGGGGDQMDLVPRWVMDHLDTDTSIMNIYTHV